LSKLPLLSWREVVKALGRAGFKIARQKGSHIILVKDERIVPVPRHGEIKRGLLMEIIPALVDLIAASLTSGSCPRKR
jgi:predicted RNA binding protein YcfA (HicA-like mRNA interferase family)